MLRNWKHTVSRIKERIKDENKSLKWETQNQYKEINEPKSRVFEEISKTIYEEITGKAEESEAAEEFDESRTTEALNMADAEYIIDD